MSVVGCAPGCAPAGGHSLLVSETVRDQRVGAAAWVDEQLDGGAKVFYTARPDGWAGGDPRWLVGPLGSARAPGAAATGQLEILDFAEVIRIAGGTTAGLRELQAGEVARGLDEGWDRIAMSQESPGRPMADDDEVAEFAAQEAGYDELARDWPLTTLCQLTLAQENPAAIRETSALHWGDIVDHQWSAFRAGGRWHLRGEVDATVAERFGAALQGALRRSEHPGTPDAALQVDATEVEFFDIASALSLTLTVRSAARRVVLHGANELVRDAIAAVGRPSTLLLADEPGAAR
jgi:hypothetical protein